jgi:hypothetical protein
MVLSDENNNKKYKRDYVHAKANRFFSAQEWMFH